jgi:TPR repeat protein
MTQPVPCSQAAAEEYRAAQKLNSPQAMFNLAYMHQWGIGFQQVNVRAAGTGPMRPRPPGSDC